MAGEVTRSEQEPHDRLTRLCNAMVEALEAAPEYSRSIKVAIMLDDLDTKRGGLVTYGYNDDADAFVRMLEHVEALAATRGMRLSFIPVQSMGGQG